MTAPALTFQHRYSPGEPTAPVLLLLHSTGGSPAELLPLADALDPRAAVLAPAGQVSEYGATRWFRRLAEGVFDFADVAARADQLADFVLAARERYSLRDRRLVAVGFSNGANIAAATLLTRPDALSEAVLFSAMMPLPDSPAIELNGTRIFLANGDNDPMAPATSTAELVRALRARSAEVTAVSHPGGHGITRAGLDAATAWLHES